MFEVKKPSEQLSHVVHPLLTENLRHERRNEEAPAYSRHTAATHQESSFLDSDPGGRATTKRIRPLKQCFKWHILFMGITNKSLNPHFPF